MALSIREFVSIIRNNLDSISTDNYVSGEYLYNVGVSYAKLFIKRESDSRKLFKNTSMFKFIDCIKMKPSKVSECTDISLPCKSIMKSVEKLPEIYLSNYGSLIMVYNITKDKDYIEANPISYKSISGQRFKPKDKGYFWIQNGYLVIPDSEVEVVSAMYLSSDMSSDSTLVSKACKILDEPFPCLDYLLIAVIESTTKHVLQTKSIIRDENANLDERQ
jgi:hypothetical protein